MQIVCNSGCRGQRDVGARLVSDAPAFALGPARAGSTVTDAVEAISRQTERMPSWPNTAAASARCRASRREATRATPWSLWPDQVEHWGGPFALRALARPVARGGLEASTCSPVRAAAWPPRTSSGRAESRGRSRGADRADRAAVWRLPDRGSETASAPARR